MFIPKFWSRVTEGTRVALGWSDASTSEAEKMARARLARIVALGEGETPSDWDYYPSSPVKEEILETPRIPEGSAVITRNRAGAQVLNVDRVAFIDIDLHPPIASMLSSIGALFRKKPAASNVQETAALTRAREWAEANAARLRAYRTAGGLRLIRMDRALDPAGEECERMFADLGADPQYARLCRIQKSFRARLTPKPRRIDCAQAPCSHPRTEPESVRGFARWLADYERAGAGKSVAAFIAEYGSARSMPAAQAVAELHDRRALLDGAVLA
jgi:hypothetical protein